MLFFKNSWQHYKRMRSEAELFNQGKILSWKQKDPSHHSYFEQRMTMLVFLVCEAKAPKSKQRSDLRCFISDAFTPCVLSNSLFSHVSYRFKQNNSCNVYFINIGVITSGRCCMACVERVFYSAPSTPPWLCEWAVWVIFRSHLCFFNTACGATQKHIPQQQHGEEEEERNKSLHISLLLHLSLSSRWDSSISYIEKPALIKHRTSCRRHSKCDVFQMSLFSPPSRSSRVGFTALAPYRKGYELTFKYIPVRVTSFPSPVLVHLLIHALIHSCESTHIQHDFICSISAISFHFLPLVILWIFQLFVFFHCVILRYLILLFVFSALYLFIHKIFPGKIFPRRAASSWAH